MNEKYKIGDVSRLLGIPAQTLRFYEEQHLLNPGKNEETGYRYYDAWDLNSLMDSLYYRSLDFSINEVEALLNRSSLEEKLDAYMKQETKILHQIEVCQEMLTVLSSKRQQIQVFQEELNTFTLQKSPGLIFFRHRLRDKFQSADGNDNFTELSEDMKPWVEQIRCATPTFLFQRLSLREDGPDELKYWWGWSMPAHEAITKGMEPVSPNEYLSSCCSVHTVFRTGGEHTFARDFYQTVYQQILDAQLVMVGNPFGRLILKVHEGDQLYRYFEVWIPVEG